MEERIDRCLNIVFLERKGCCRINVGWEFDPEPLQS